MGTNENQAEIKYRLRNKRENYLSHLQKSIVDNVTNIYGILCISTISLIAGAWALYHAWRLNNNSEKLVENLDPDILPTGVFLMLAALASGALLPYFSQALRCNNILSFSFTQFFHCPCSSRAFALDQLIALFKKWMARPIWSFSRPIWRQRNMAGLPNHNNISKLSTVSHSKDTSTRSPSTKLTNNATKNETDRPIKIAVIPNKISVIPNVSIRSASVETVGISDFGIKGRSSASTLNPQFAGLNNSFYGSDNCDRMMNQTLTKIEE